MSRVAIFEGLGRHRRRRLHSRRRSGYRSYGRKHSRRKGSKTAARRKFATAAKVCAIQVKRSGRWSRRKFGDCIKRYLRSH